MNSTNRLPSPPLSQGPQILIVEAAPGRARRAHLQQWIDELGAAEANAWLLSCDFADGGSWAGVKDLFGALIPRFRKLAPALMVKHDYELAAILPAQRRSISVRNPSLTDLADKDEKVRNFAIDRAYRIVHGLIDLLEAWHATGAAGSSWTLVCDAYDCGGALLHRFFRELLRRRGHALSVKLVLVIEPGKGDSVAAEFDAAWPIERVRLALTAIPEDVLSTEEAVGRLRELSQRVRGDIAELESCLPELIRLSQQSGQSAETLKWQSLGLGICNHYGFYEDAMIYSRSVLPHLEEISGGSDETRWNLVGNLFNAASLTGDPDEGYRIVEKEAVEKITDPRFKVRICYILAMLYARYLSSEKRDLARAERYLQDGLDGLVALDLPPDEKYFQMAFMMNGMALIRHRQGRPVEAVELCRSGLSLLEQHLEPTRHRLHRSVLFYNIAQVYAAIGAFEEAIESFSSAMAMDPNYSEYFNDRGNSLLKLGRYEEAVADYLKAIELSPPYLEVFTNLGQCYRLMNRMAEAVATYSIAIDLDPKDVLPVEGRAQAHDALGQMEEALADYDTILALTPSRDTVLANRAVLCYQLGRLDASIADLDQAISISPDVADFYQNRAVALGDLGRREEAIRDLLTYLKLAPEAEDRAEVEEKLSALRAESAAAPFAIFT